MPAHDDKASPPAAPDPPALTAYLWAVVVGAVPALVVVADLAIRHRHTLLGAQPLITATFVAVLVVGELFPIPVARGVEAGDDITVSSTFGFALLLTAPLAVAIVAQVVALALDCRVHGGRWARVPFNSAQYALAFVAARIVYCAVDGVGFTPKLHEVPAIGAALLAAATFLVVNNFLVGVAIALQTGARLFTVLSGDLTWQIGTSAPLLGLGPLAAEEVRWSPFAIVLLIVPIVALHRSGRLAMRREQEALRDTLTGLPNRLMLTAVAERALGGAHAEVAMLLVDLDHFKDINDTLGHAVGDQVLVAVADRLRTVVGPGDLVCRLGGDEFAVLHRGSSEHVALLAERVCEAVQRPVLVQQVTLTVGCSVGISLAPLHADSLTDLLRCADVALYTAKVTRGATAVYDPRTDRRSATMLGLPADLRQALEDDSDTTVWVAYQPQLDLATGTVTSVECLARWDHPHIGPVSPDVFVPVAENTALIELLLERVLDRALDQLLAWDTAGVHLSASVNLSVRHLSDLGLPARVAKLLQRKGVASERLVLEVTETRLMSNPERSAAVLGQLNDLGVRLSVDDFGTGYSSLAYLQRLPVDELKIDRTFIAEMASSGATAIVRSTIELGHNLGLVVVAEGVEDLASARRLRELGCDLLQGFAIARPVGAGDFLEALPAARAAGRHLAGSHDPVVDEPRPGPVDAGLELLAGPTGAA